MEKKKREMATDVFFQWQVRKNYTQTLVRSKREGERRREIYVRVITITVKEKDYEGKGKRWWKNNN